MMSSFASPSLKEEILLTYFIVRGRGVVGPGFTREHLTCNSLKYLLTTLQHTSMLVYLHVSEIENSAHRRSLLSCLFNALFIFCFLAIFLFVAQDLNGLSIQWAEML